MLIYIACFALSLLLFRFVQSLESKYSRSTVMLLAILLPVFLAAFRHESIGTDVKVYVTPMVDAALQADNLTEFMSMRVDRTRLVSDFEIGFSFMAYVLVKVFGNLQAVLFAIQFAIVSLVAGGVYKFRKEFPTWQGMAVFYFMFYNVTLNAMRQWIAIGFLLYACYDLLHGKKRFFIWAGISALFHTSGILFGFAFYLLAYFLVGNTAIMHTYSGRDQEILAPSLHIGKRGLKVAAIVTCACVALIMLPAAVWVLELVGLQKYTVYLQGTVKPIFSQIIVRSPVLLLLLLYGRKMVAEDARRYFFVAVILIEAVLTQLISIGPHYWRVYTCFTAMYVLVVPLLCNSIQRKNNRIIATILMMGYMLVYWLYYFAYQGIHQTVPYLFS